MWLKIDLTDEHISLLIFILFNLCQLYVYNYSQYSNIYCREYFDCSKNIYRFSSYILVTKNEHPFFFISLSGKSISSN
ncbi:hypothetical protein PIROE2DRAFT_14389 [Piromyces sp. E2]|nr:hypothetical protein PIROE2DRAFT_14389 [Piromyces sp. E2]|eukprot:OUM59945.1 hypothetical protein PIROE2DRAFT_14389 [Piromyces sp. E2]